VRIQGSPVPRHCARSIAFSLALLAAACAAPQAPPPSGPPPPSEAPPISTEQPYFTQEGVASWYGSFHQGKPTANGERFDMKAISAAHRTLPMNTVVRVTNLDNRKTIKIRINDRGPYARGRIIDLSELAAHELGMRQDGVAKVRIEAFRSDQPANARPLAAESSEPDS
jgi:rare lipoprotein A